MQIIRTVNELLKTVDEAILNGRTIGLVPTMGALHQGHMSLVERAIKENDITFVSIFVNPTQFNNSEDLEHYPRTEAQDIELLENAGVDVAFIPSSNEVYPEPDNRIFDLGEVAEVMEGKMRPGHFNGVAQIVSKLFKWIKPTKAYFGEKDFQQIAVIRSMVKNEKFDLEIVDCPISRENSGLARSSRNERLTKEQRQHAAQIYKTLKQSKDWQNEGLKPSEVIDKVIATLDQIPFLKPEYFNIVNSVTLQPIAQWSDTDLSKGEYPIGCIAVYCGDVRLIDNIKYID